MTTRQDGRSKTVPRSWRFTRESFFTGLVLSAKSTARRIRVLARCLADVYGQEHHQWQNRLRHSARLAGPERLECRVVLSSIVFLDFGFNFPPNGLFVDDALSASVNGPTRFDPGGNTLIPLVTTIANENIDLNDDGMADLTDAMIFADGVVEAVRRTFEPFNVNVIQNAASDFTAIRDALAAHVGGFGNRDGDAYIIVAGDDPTSNPAFGWGVVDTGNVQDNTAYVFADQIIRRLGATIPFVASTAAHETGHSFGLDHTNGSAISGTGDVMSARREGELSQRNIFVQHFMTRFDLELQEGSGTQNNFNVLADSIVVGLKTGAPSYVTGTGAYDRITITPASFGFTDVVVEVFDASTMDPEDLIATGSYLINSNNPNLVETGARDDHVVYDVGVDQNVEVRGGGGVDTLVVQGGVATYSPGPSGEPSEGTLTVEGVAIAFSEMEYVRPVAPQFTSVNATVENLTVMLTAEFIDPGTLSGYTVVVDWGDGSDVTEMSLIGLGRSFEAAHHFVDDNPSGPIVVTLIDDDGLQDTASVDVSDRLALVWLTGLGQTYVQDFDSLDTPGSALPTGWSAVTGPETLTTITDPFPSLAVGSGTFNAGEGGDRTLATGNTASGQANALRFFSKITDESDVRAVRLSFSVEAWAGGLTADSPGEAAYAVDLEVDRSGNGDWGGVWAFNGGAKISTGLSLTPGPLDGNSQSNRVMFDSGLVELQEAIPAGSNIRLTFDAQSIGQTSGYVFGLDDLLLRVVPRATRTATAR